MTTSKRDSSFKLLYICLVYYYYESNNNLFIWITVNDFIKS